MKNLHHIRTRRQLFRVMAVSAASVPLLALARKSAFAGQGQQGQQGQPRTSCLLKGTKISTPAGDRPVEELQIGDEVWTLAGRRAIKWIGYNKFTKEEGRPWQDSVMPVRVARFALNDDSPRRDLYLSPQHCIFINESLIPVVYLINENSIAQGTPSDMSALEYYHVEFDTHEVIFAEGASVESYDGWNREVFSNFVQYERLYGRERRSSMKPFAPILRYDGRVQELKGLIRSLVSDVVVDVRDPIQIAYDQLAKRAEAMLV